jgi:hypothetical protein
MAKATSSGASRTVSKTVSRPATRTKAAPGKPVRKPAAPERKPAAPERKPAAPERKPAAPERKPAAPERKPAAAAPVVEPKPAAAPACPKSAEITTINAAMRFLLARPDFERQRALQYGEHTFKLDRMQRILGNLGNPHQKV